MHLILLALHASQMETRVAETFSAEPSHDIEVIKSFWAIDAAAVIIVRNLRTTGWSQLAQICVDPRITQR